MDIKKLINERVTHSTLGNGHIIDITKNSVSVKFAKDKIQFFSFPNTFKNNIIRFIDIDHDEVLMRIEKEKPTVIEPKKEEPTIIKPIKDKPISAPIKEKPSIIEPNKEEPTIIKPIKEKPISTPIKETISDYEIFLNEFAEYWKERKLLAYLVVKYANEKEIYKNLKETVIKIIKKTIKEEPTSFDKGLVTIFIAMIAHQEYDGTIWPYIERELEELYLKEKELEINKAIRKLIADNEFGGEVSVLIHAGIFIKYYKDYYVFMDDIYKINFNNNILNAPVEEILTATFKGIKEDLMKEDNNLLYLKLIDSTYYLSKYTKYALIIAPAEMAKLTKHFLRHLNLWYHENKYDKTQINLHKALKLWLEMKEAKASKITIDKKPYINKPVFKFNSSSMKVTLNYPPVNIVDIKNLNYKKLKIKLLVDKTKTRLKVDSDYRIYQRIGYYSVIIDEYIINNPLAEIKLIVSYNKKIIYRSSKEISKKTYVFNEKGEELKSTDNYSGFFYLVHKTDEIFLNAKEYLFETHKISYLKADEINNLNFKDKKE